MTTDDFGAALTRLEAALHDIIRLRIEAGEGATESPFITGWVVAYEYTTKELEDSESSGEGVVVPTTQYRSTSRGLFGLGERAF